MKISLRVWSVVGVNSFKTDDDGEVTDFENDNENTFDFIFNFLPKLSDTVLHQWINFCHLARQNFWPVNNLLVNFILSYFKKPLSLRDIILNQEKNFLPGSSIETKTFHCV